MDHVVKTPKNPGLSVRLRSDWLAAILRVDAIRTDTLVQLVQHWTEDPEARTDVITALDLLAADVARDEGSDKILNSVEYIESVSGMEYAEEELSIDCVRRLRKELDEVADTLNRFQRIEHP